ncbi:MAG: DUF1015 domain-containing protein [Nitrospinaceae bacterium]|jgi:uncharacterized protein (DUF1015 family)|nr:DUF1015 domain-containing protein [Nitrospinaceae bacterium]MBT3432630.1 DUF1015 domain-containing protein [Nitrospinaceae bacterium]MBT3820146.1 DUF1015 domain-containing protein [Nitrospinaceae bacterium]MBT4430444.1 DUF1015 domain-containing protein [Nitrospinaceae bacterium]MBT5366827.1 DUF1015 domain-containing protein [Nitrospinaceae bacterium]
MVDIRPFRGLRHAGLSPDKIGEVTSPPYDVFDPEMQRAYYERHPNNVIRLILGIVEPGESDDKGRIDRATQHIKDWKREGVLALDDTPAIYPYLQKFTLPDGTALERRAFFTSIRLEKYGEGKIHPHEQTFPKTKTFLFNLYGSCGTHFGPIFSFYDDPADAASKAMAATMAGEPVADFEEDGVRHTLWRCDDPETIASVQKSLSGCEAFIADGHHRYETSLALKDAARKAGAAEGGEADYTLMCLANVSDPGMAVLPTHRLLKKINATVDEVLASIASGYEITEAPAPATGAGGEVAQKLKELAGGGRSAFCLYDGKGSLRYLVKNESGAASGDVNKAVASLDVSRLHADIVDTAFGTSHDEAEIAFTPDPEIALASARDGECEVAILLNPTPVEAVVKIARAGGKMPHKSTYFFPKLRTGLVFHAFAPPATD